MAVPVGGSFSMFGTGDNSTIAGAIVEGGATLGTVSDVDNFNELKGLANIDKFDPLYIDGATDLSGIVETIQFRGYPILVCDAPTAFSGGQSYPSSQSVQLGSGTGEVILDFEAFGVPDRFIMHYDDTVVIDTGYRGTSNYDFGGADRSSFNASLSGKVDPILETTYPDISNFPDDGYPRIVSPGDGTASFLKNTTSPTIAQVQVYGPMAGTAWNFTAGCPAIDLTVAAIRLVSDDCGGDSSAAFDARIYLDITDFSFVLNGGVLKVNNGTSVNTLPLPTYNPSFPGIAVDPDSVDSASTALASAGTYLIQDDSLTDFSNDVQVVVDISGNATLQTCGL